MEYDLDTRRLLCAERVEQLARDAGPRREQQDRHRSRRSSLHNLLRPAAHRRRAQPTG
jgi:hypothetical protein